MVTHFRGGHIGRYMHYYVSFITNLAFPGHHETITATEIAILLASLSEGLFGYFGLGYWLLNQQLIKKK